MEITIIIKQILDFNINSIIEKLVILVLIIEKQLIKTIFENNVL